MPEVKTCSAMSEVCFLPAAVRSEVKEARPGCQRKEFVSDPAGTVNRATFSREVVRLDDELRVLVVGSAPPAQLNRNLSIVQVGRPVVEGIRAERWDRTELRDIVNREPVEFRSRSSS